MPLSVGVVAENIVRRDGQGRVALEVCRTLSKRGHNVTAVSAALGEEIRGYVDWAKVDVGGGSQLARDMVFAHRARRKLASANLDVVLTMGACVMPSNLATVYYAAFTHFGWRRFWSQARYRPDLYHRIHNLWFLVREKKALRRATKVIVMSHRMALEVDRVVGAPTRAEVIPGAVDASEYPGDSQDRVGARRQLGIDPQMFVICVIGEHSTGRKGLDVLARAVAIGEGDELVLIHGHGPEALTRKRMRKIGALVDFPDPSVAVANVMAASDVTAIPSLYEPFSLVALEAAAAGCPVIISSVAGAADHLGPADAAFVVPPNEPAALRAAIDSLRAAPDRGTAMALRAREVALMFDWESVTARIADVIEATAVLGEERC